MQKLGHVDSIFLYISLILLNKYWTKVVAEFMTSKMEYEETHAWINFRFPLDGGEARLWLLLGEAMSKCQHVASMPMRPDISAHLHKIWLVKGIHATTAIEGNTLTEAEITAQLEGKLEDRPSKDYLVKEVENIEAVLQAIAKTAHDGAFAPLDPATILSYHEQILRGLPAEEHCVPGEFRRTSVGVPPRYRGAPWKEVPYLIERLCEWLTRDLNPPTERERMLYGILKAIIAHIYIAWIHPFGDGNGRTARALEFRLLMEAGVPLPSAHLLSDHYNNTRQMYYSQLDASSKGSGNILPFLQYAMQGFVDGLKDQIQVIRAQQLQIIWQNYVHDCIPEGSTAARRRHLVLDVTDYVTANNWEAAKESELYRLTPRLVSDYKNKSQRSITRDVNWLIAQKLLRRTKKGLEPNISQILGFLPVAYKPTEEKSKKG